VQSECLAEDSTVKSLSGLMGINAQGGLEVANHSGSPSTVPSCNLPGRVAITRVQVTTFMSAGMASMANGLDLPRPEPRWTLACRQFCGVLG
jgi:hypothetical protein